MSDIFASFTVTVFFNRANHLVFSEFGRKLSCMRKAQEFRALECVDSLTKPIKKALLKIYLTNMSMVDLAQKASCL